ncbi:hypothetical protein LTR78_008875 [Recurvomyces mirabilis]|uniref:NAD(P)-binding protein n=1 Tax=Recurvomyces mirabilis TaxID=574656 RepID=A0AAE0TQJ2_9PEZI|nr:hypothetical protein LTR78_008875 [Recurvomyces mirabilis]KAK5155790.1 hypothetical protein LTS14_005356 [Recurvomyces mirabilis]
MAPQKTAYVTGAASGIGRQVTEMLAARKIRVAAADKNYEGVKSVAAYLNNQSQEQDDLVKPYEVDTGDWDSQLSVFESVLKDLGGRIDYVYSIAGIGERVSVPNDPKAKGFVKPDLSVLDVDLYGFLYTSSLALQQMRRQEKGEDGFRGKTLPMYTAAKHGIVGYVRSFGKYLPEEGITLNAVCPNVVQTGISTASFYDTLADKDLLTPIEIVVDAFASFLDGKMSGECIEAGPKGNLVPRAPAEHLDRESAEVMEMLYSRGHALHQPKS